MSITFANIDFTTAQVLEYRFRICMYVIINCFYYELLSQVRAVDIAKQTIQVQMNLSINWKDMRLKYHNLKDDMNLNLVSYLPYTGIWLPYIEV